MDKLANHDQAVDLLQELGLKEYEARSLVALSRIPKGTAKDVSEISDVPRTRVYEAIRVLETKGLVEIQHSNPKQFRAVSIDEAVETLRSEYEERADSLRQTLQGLEPVAVADEADVTHEVWALSGGSAITSRTNQLIAEAERELVMVIGHRSVFTDDLIERVQDARQRGVDVIVGTNTEEVRDLVQDALPEIEVFISGLEWLGHSALPGDDTEISRLVLIDRETILVSSFTNSTVDGREQEQAVFGRGFDNGLVTIVRRLMATGLLSADEPDA